MDCFAAGRDQVTRIDTVVVAELDKSTVLITLNAFDPQHLCVLAQRCALQQVACRFLQHAETVNQLHL